LQHIGDSKIGTIKSKPNVKYPMIRLPQEYAEIIGQRAHVYKTDQDGQPAFLVVPYTQESAQLTAESKPKVSKLSLETEAKSRLSALESQIAELKSLIFQDGSEADADRENHKAEGEIRTRVVASTGPLPLPTAQMCHKTSFDLSCRTG